MTDDASLHRRYLLGELGESERDDLEAKLLTSDEHFEELLIAEDELVDDFHAGKLSASEEEHYRAHFLASKERRDQHRFGAALREHVAAAAGKENGRGSWHVTTGWLAAAAVAVLAVGVYVVVESHRPYSLQPSPAGTSGPSAAFFLATDTLRGLPDPGEPPQTIRIPAGVDHIELQLDVPSASDYHVTLANQGGSTVAEGTLPARSLEGQWVVVAAVPSELLAPGDYRVILERRDEPSARETFVFRVSSP